MGALEVCWNAQHNFIGQAFIEEANDWRIYAFVMCYTPQSASCPFRNPFSQQWSVVKSPVARHAVGSQAPRHDALATDIMLPSKEAREDEDA